MSIKEDYTSSEKEAIAELRKRLEDQMEPEMYEDTRLFYRFLTAREFNMTNAEAMLRKHLLWQKKVDLKNHIMPEVFDKYYPYNFLGYDKEGSVLRYVPLGKADLVGIFYNLTLEEVERSMAYIVQEDIVMLKEQSKKLKKNIEKLSLIYDMQDFNYRHFIDKKVVQGCLTLVRSFEQNCPERLKIMYVINGSAYITIIYKLLKSVLGATILKKIHICNDDSWKSEVMNLVDPDVLPAFLGGTRTDPDGNPKCVTFISYGGKVPEKYYIQKRKTFMTDLEGVKKVTIPRSSLLKEIFEVKDPGIYLEWEFEAKCQDIGFGLFYEDVTDSEKLIELIPLQRIDTKNRSEAGRYFCEKAGKYVFKFDNSNSWMRNTELFYRINIITSEDS